MKAFILGIPAVTALVLLAGCGSAEEEAGKPAPSSPFASSTPTDPAFGASDPAAQPSDDAAALGEKLIGTGYSFSAPQGWGAPPQTPAGFDPDVLGMNLSDDDGFSDNVNVIVQPASVDKKDLGDAAVKELTGAGAEDVHPVDAVQAGGDLVPRVSAVMAAGSVKYRVEQAYIIHDDSMYVVTYSFSNDVSTADREAAVTPSLKSWTWSD